MSLVAHFCTRRKGQTVSNNFHAKSHKGEKGEKKYLVTPVIPKSEGEISAGTGYVADLKEILRKRDVFGFRNFLQKTQRALPDEMLADIIKLETMMHQLIVSMPDLSEWHVESRAWLNSNTLLIDGQSLMEAARISPEERWEEFEANQRDETKPARRTIFLRTPRTGKTYEDN